MSITIAALPRMTDDAFADVLRRAQSPAAPVAPTLYAVCVGRGVDPAVALAFFQHESTYGKAGKARHTLNWGNLRRGPRAFKVEPVGGSGGPFAWYRTWRESLEDFCDLLRGPLYEGRGLRTVAEVIPLYAPAADGNRPTAYITAVERAVAGWSAADPWAPWGEAYPLARDQRAFAIPRAWFHAQPPLGPAIGPEVGLGPSRAAQAFRDGVIVWMGGDTCHIVREAL